MQWKNMTAAELQRVDRRVPVVLPLAAVEQHGPHLPVATDWMIAEHFCREVDRKIGKDVLLLPTVNIACSRHHLDFGGTLTARHETFIEYIKEILDSVAAQGFRNLVLFNAHGGNQAAGNVIVESWGMSNPECRIAMLTWWRVASTALLEITETGPGG